MTYLNPNQLSCPKYSHIRIKYTELLERNHDIKLFLNPSITDEKDVAIYLLAIDRLLDGEVSQIKLVVLKYIIWIMSYYLLSTVY